MKKVLALLGAVLAAGSLYMLWSVASNPSMSHFGKWVGLAFAITAMVAGVKFLRIAVEPD